MPVRLAARWHPLHSAHLLLVQEPVRQKKPRQAKPRPGSDVPSFIIVADAPPAPSPSQAPSPRSASIAGAARTPSEQSKPGWQSTLLDQLYKAPAEPTAAPPPAALRSDAALQVPETPAPAAPAAAQQAPVSMPQQPARLDPPSPAAAAAVRSPPAANTHSDDPHTAREQSLGDQGTSPAKIRQLRPRRSASARDAGPLQSAAGAAVAPPGAAPSEDTLSRFVAIICDNYTIISIMQWCCKTTTNNVPDETRLLKMWVRPCGPWRGRWLGPGWLSDQVQGHVVALLRCVSEPVSHPQPGTQVLARGTMPRTSQPVPI